ncbi:hypothetical protein ACT496_004243, partial [Salmonella enterica subsp. diarizonae serovar 21:z10:e,n,x,z15]
YLFKSKHYFHVLKESQVASRSELGLNLWAGRQLVRKRIVVDGFFCASTTIRRVLALLSCIEQVPSSIPV